MRIAILAGALCVAACGGSDNQPAQDPSSTRSETTLTAAPAPAPAPVVETTSTTATQPTSSLPSTDSTATPSAPSGPATSSDTTRAAASDTPATAGSPDADNTKMNERDRHGTLTPMNQGNSSDEVKITAAIRRGLMGDKSLSFTAKNVKIITTGTKVTLRGPVKSEAEKSAIESRAKQTPGVTEVDDQIEVKK